MLSKNYKIFAYTTIVSWIFIMTYLFGFGNFSPSNIDIQELGNISGLASGSEEYLGVYFQDKKIGYIINRTENVDSEIVIKHYSRLNLSIQGYRQAITIEGGVRLSKDLIMRSFNFKVNAERQEFIVVGNTEGNRFVIRSNLVGFKTLVLDNSTPIFLDMNLNRYIARHKLHSSRRMSYKVFSLEGFSAHTVDVQLVGTERITIMNEEIYAYHLKKRFKDYVIDSWIDLNGKTLKESSDIGFVLIRESAKGYREEFADLDIVSQFSILPDKSIPDIFSLSEITVRIQGVNITPSSLDGGRQFVDGDNVIIKSELVSNRIEEITESEREKYLSPEPFIQVDNEEITSLATKIVEGEKDDRKRLEKINEYLFKNIKKRSVVGFPDAYTTLKNMEGDCNEHTSLFVAIARSIGIPSRVAAGIAYLNGRFYYHAWAEAYLNNRWISFDPTWGESPANVGHIRLTYGDIGEIMNIAKYINRIRVEVVGWK